MTWNYHAIPDLSEEQYARWRCMLEERTGIFFAEHKSILQAGLTRRMREVECLDYEQYYRKITGDQSGAIEWIALLNTLTVKETSFFRHEEAFDYVRTYLAALLQDWHAASEKSLQLWSVGCATGEEAYSLAMVASDCIREAGSDVNFGVTAADISLAALADARKGVYARRKLRRVDDLSLERYFENLDDNAGTVVPALKQRVCFVQSNIIDMQDMPLGEMDIIFCQNVLIYFRRWRQNEVLNNLAERLKPGGLMVVGLGEAINWSHSKIQRLPAEKIQAYVRL